MESKEVKIIGLSVNKKMGILNAFKMEFDPDNRMLSFKGKVGQGKTTIKTALDLSTKGQKTLVDKKLYGEVDTETQLLDGQTKVYVGCKTVNGSLEYTLYTKDDNGKIVKNPVIDGVSATPSKYLELLQTELTWRMDELTSENPTVQRKILLDLYKFDLQKHGIIFDKLHPDYAASILGRIDAAVKERDMSDMMRKQKGGIYEDLKAQGYDCDRPDTIPCEIDLKKIEADILSLKTTIALEKQKRESDIKAKKTAITTKVEELTLKCTNYNNSIDDKFKIWETEENAKETKIKEAQECQDKLKSLGYTGNEVLVFISNLPQKKELEKPKKILFDEMGRIVLDMETKEKEVLDIYIQVNDCRAQYSKVLEEEVIPYDTKEIDTQIQELEVQKEQAEHINKIVDAVHSFHEWRACNENVKSLKKEYYKMMTSINTGVKGLYIVCEEDSDDIYLTYDGSYDPEYFGNKEGELRKLAGYSGTQKPLICLLIQHYLLGRKPKSLRTMYIDNVPMDNKTQEVLKSMAEELQITILLNITGDFEVSQLKDGEILVEGGELFFN